MSKSEIKTVSEYLSSLPDDRKKALTSLRNVVRENLPTGVKERMNWGMISYEVPLKTYPDTYNGQPLMFAAIASQKNHMALYLTCVYMDKKSEKAFRDDFKAAGKKLDMGKSCVRFKKLEDLSLEAIAKRISSVSLKQFIKSYENAHGK